MDDAKLVEILGALVAQDEVMRSDGREPRFSLFQAAGGRVALRPSIGLEVTEADLRDLIAAGYLRELASRDPRERLKFIVTSAGRAVGRANPVVVELDRDGAPLDVAPAPALDEVLAWVIALEDHSPSVLVTGGALVNQALADFDERQLDGACRRLIELADEGLIAFTDPAARLPQLPAPDRIGKGSEFRVTMAGRDRNAKAPSQAGMTVTQIIHATNAQIAGRDITNFVSFGELLDAVQDQLDQLTDLDEGDRQEAQSIIDKLRSATTQVTLTAAGAGGGTVIGAILMSLLHLHS